MRKSSFLSRSETKLNLYFGKKAPPLPENIKNFLVKFTPHFVVLLLIISLPALLNLFGIYHLYFGKQAYYLPSRFSLSLPSLLALAATIFAILSLRPLLSRLRQGWLYLFYAVWLYCLSYFFRLDLFSLFFFALVSFYLLFQLRSYYRN